MGFPRAFPTLFRPVFFLSLRFTLFSLLSPFFVEGVSVQVG
jgi:hypothetical protein